MVINEITYSQGKTIQEASYEPRSFHFSAKAELSEKDKPQECYDKLREEVQKALDREVTQTEKNQLAKDRVIDFIKTKVLHARNATALNSVDKDVNIS